MKFRETENANFACLYCYVATVCATTPSTLATLGFAGPTEYKDISCRSSATQGPMRWRNYVNTDAST